MKNNSVSSAAFPFRLESRLELVNSTNGYTARDGDDAEYKIVAHPRRRAGLGWKFVWSEWLDLAFEEVASPKDNEALHGVSNGGSDYFGRAKIYAQMGTAVVEASLPLHKTEV